MGMVHSSYGIQGWRGLERGGAHPRSLLEAMTRSQSRTLCFFRYFFVKYLRYLRLRTKYLGFSFQEPAV